MMHVNPFVFVQRLALCFAAFVITVPLQGQVLSRLRVLPFAEELEVSYTLKTDQPVTVQLYYSEDDGIQWNGPLKSVSGDVGRQVSGGKNKIVWNFAEEVNELFGDGFRFKVRTSEHYSFSAKLSHGSFARTDKVVRQDFGGDPDRVAFLLRQVPGWNNMDVTAPSGHYFFNMNHDLAGKGVSSSVEVTGFRSRPAMMGMLFNAVLPGSGIPYVTHGEAKGWNIPDNGRDSKFGNGNFWGIALFGGLAVLCHNLAQDAYNEELNRTFGTEETAKAAAETYTYGKYVSGGVAGLIYTLQLTRTFKWSKAHKSDMAEFVAGQ